MSVRYALLLAALVFVITMLTRLPASLVLDHWSGPVHCTGASGTLWHGSCERLAVGPGGISGLQWTAHPAALLRARLAADVTSSDPAASGQAYLEWQPGGELLIEQLTAHLAPAALVAWLPSGLRASLQLAVARARLRAGHVIALEGTLDLQQLQLQLPAPGTALGSYELRFAPYPESGATADGTMQGTLRDLEGPLSLRGQVRLHSTGRYELSGRLAARPQAGTEVQRLLELLGPADADGTRAIDFAGVL